jgi:hypothetical protein
MVFQTSERRNRTGGFQLIGASQVREQNEGGDHLLLCDCPDAFHRG